MVLKENRVSAFGDFAEITQAGFNIVEILQSQNKALNNEISEKSKLGKAEKNLLQKLSDKAQ